MQVLCDARDKLDIPWEHPTSQLAANEAVMFHSGCLLDAEQFHQYVPLINILWTDGAIRKAYDRRREFQIVSQIVREKGNKESPLSVHRSVCGGEFQRNCRRTRWTESIAKKKVMSRTGRDFFLVLCCIQSVING